MLLMTFHRFIYRMSETHPAVPKCCKKTPLDQRSERYIGNFQVERTKKTSKKYAQRVLNSNEWCSHNEITNDTSMHTDYMSFNRFKSNKHSVAELTTGAHAQLTHTTRFRTSESNCDRLYYFLFSRFFSFIFSRSILSWHFSIDFRNGQAISVRLYIYIFLIQFYWILWIIMDIYDSNWWNVKRFLELLLIISEKSLVYTWKRFTRRCLASYPTCGNGSIEAGDER